MDEKRTEQNTPQEVVLRYEPETREVVERYVQPMRLPGRKAVQAPAQSTQPPRRKKRRALKIALICLALLVLLAVVGLAVAFFSGVLRGFTSDSDFTYRPYTENLPQSGLETTIPRYRYDETVRIRYEETHGEKLTIQKIYETVNPSTVTVMTALPGNGGMIGTGVIMTADGYVLTNAHVIVGGTESYVVLDTGMYYFAELVGFDEEKDLAVLKVDAEDLPAVEFGDSDALTVGDTVYAIGNPLGVELRGTLTDGIVSAINRDVQVDGVTMTLIQTNAALNNGNSGGPLINVYGQVVGINTMKMGSTSTNHVEGLGFAIPISSSAYMINDLIACGEIHGEAVIGISVNTKPVTLPSGETAVEVYTVTKDGPGEKAGLQVGDYILTADGEALSDSDDLIRIRRRYGAGETLHLQVERSGERFETDIVLAAEEE